MNRQLLQWAAFGVIAAVAILVLQDHLGHLRQVLPFILVLACPLMHMFMHRGHGAHPADQAPPHADHRGLDRHA